jgi:Ca-activated chloride channel family protein
MSYYNRFRNRKGGTIQKNGVVQSYQRDNNDEVVVTKLNRASLETIAKSKGGYVNGNNTKG